MIGDLHPIIRSRDYLSVENALLRYATMAVGELDIIGNSLARYAIKNAGTPELKEKLEAHIKGETTPVIVEPTEIEPPIEEINPFPAVPPRRVGHEGAVCDEPFDYTGWLSPDKPLETPVPAEPETPATFAEDTANYYC